MSAKTGDQWLALYCDSAVYELRLVTVLVDSVPDPIYGSDDGRGLDGRKVSTEPPGDVVFLIRDVAGLIPGRIRSAYRGHLEPGEGRPETITLDRDEKYVFKVSNRVYSVVRSSDGKRQVLFDCSKCPSDAGLPIPYVLWAGDLDRDGYLDLLFEGDQETGESTFTLCLSSHASRRTLFGAVAGFHLTGD